MQNNYKFHWRQLVFFLALFSFTGAYAQIGIGTTAPDSSSVLELRSTSKGILIPRMASVQRQAIRQPAKGLMVFDNDSSYFFYYDGAAWKALKTLKSSSYTAGPGITINSSGLVCAQSSTSVWNANKLQSLSISPALPSNNQVLKWNGILNEWTPATDTGGASYNAGAGLSLSGTTFSAQNTVAQWNSNQIQGRNISPKAPSNNQVMKWNSALNEWTPATDTGSAYNAGTGMSLTGNTFSAQNTTAQWNANQVQGKNVSPKAPVNNQIMKWNSALNEWTPATDTGAVYTSGNSAIVINGTIITANNTTAQWNANEIQGNNVSPKVPANNQVMKWNSALNEWTPATDTSASYSSGNNAITISGTTITANNTTAQWNANEIQGNNVSPKAPANNQVMKWNSTLNEWTPATDTSASYSSGNNAITINGTTITANNTTAQWNANQVQGKNVSPKAPANNQVMKWNSALNEWTPATDTSNTYSAGTGMSLSGNTFSAQNTTAQWNANQILGKNVSPKAPANNQVMKWNSTLNEWTPATDTGAYYTAGTGISLSGNTINSSWTSSGTSIYNNNTGNIGIGTSTPNASAVLDLTSTTQGFLMPRMTSVQRKAIASPATGLIVFDLTTDSIYVFNGTKWATFTSSGNSTPSSGNNWSTTGNSGTGTGNFIGTTDNNAFNIKENNVQVGNFQGNSIALGNGSTINNSTNSYALGSSATVGYNKKYSVAIGDGSAINNDSAFAFGNAATVNGYNSFAIGNNSTANGTATLAIGPKSTTGYNINGAVALGQSSNVSSDSAYAIGNNAQANGKNTIALGSNSAANNVNGIAIGKSALAAWSITDGIALGHSAQANSDTSFAIGTSAQANSRNSFAIGSGAQSNSINSFAIGRNSSVSWSVKDAIALGDNANAAANNSIAIGSSSTSSGKTQSNGINTIAIGSSANTNSASGIAIGRKATVGYSVTTSMAIGDSAYANGSNSVVIGAGAYVGSYSNAVALGSGSSVYGNNATAIGPNAKVSANNALVLGNGVNVGVGTSAPNSSAILDLTSTSQGLLAPRMTSAQRKAIASPATGLMVFDNTADSFYYYNGTKWTNFSGGASSASPWTTSGSNIYNSNTSNVGIGKASPSYQLDVKGPVNADSILIGGYTALSTKGNGNLLIGSNSGIKNTGTGNLFVGPSAGLNNTANNNTFIGNSAGYSNTSGSANHFEGYYTGFYNTTGSSNYFSGQQAGYNNTTGSYNEFVGNNAGMKTSTGSNNTFAGQQSGYNNTTGSRNSYYGYNAGYNNITGSQNEISGYQAGNNGASYSYDVIHGYQSGYNNNGNYNTFIGYNSGYTNTSGIGNTFLGNYSGFGYTGTHNTFIGDSADAGTAGLTNATAIGYNARVGQSNSIVLGNGANVGVGTTTPNSTALLDLTSTTQGVLVPRMTTAQRAAIVSPATGLMVYDNSLNSFYYYNGTAWTALSAGGSTWATSGSNIYNSNAANVGIGKTNPYHGLDVKTAINSDSAYMLNGAPFLSTKGTSNFFLGRNAGKSNAGGAYNFFAGDSAGLTNTTGTANYFGGYRAGYGNTSGSSNMFLGFKAGNANTTGSRNTFIGDSAGINNTTGHDNFYLGEFAGYSNATGSMNVCIGNVTGTAYGINDVSVGAYSGGVGGSYNTMMGYFAGGNSTGAQNAYYGNLSGYNNSTGSQNTFIGDSSGYTNTSGSNNTYIGYNAGASGGTFTNATAIGSGAMVGASNSLVLGNGANVGIGTSTPGNKLEINSGTGGASGLRLKELPSGAVLFMSSTNDVAQNNNNFYFDATNYRLSVSGGTSPNSTITDGGSFAAAIVTKTGSYTASVSDYTIICNSPGAMTITLPAVSGCTGRIYVIKNVNNGSAVTVQGNSGSDKIDGSTTYKLSSQYNAVTIQSDGTNWWILNHN